MLEKVLKRRLVVGLTVFLIIFSGLITLYQLPRREIPLIEHPMAMITTVYPGATASQVEQYVTRKLEAELAGISDIKETSSCSQPGLSQITVKADSGKGNTKVWNQVQQKLELADFPEGVQEPLLETDLQLQGVAIYQIVAEQEGDLYALNAFLDKWEMAFSQLPGVAQVQIQGMPEREILLEIDPARMLAAGLSPTRIMQNLQREIRPSPPGKWNLTETVYQLRVDRSADVTELLNIPLSGGTGNSTLRLGDIANVKEVFQAEREMVTYQGKPAISLSFFAGSGIDLVRVDREVSELMGKMEQELPETVQIFQVYTQAEAISKMFRSLGIAFLLAMFFVVLISSAGLNRYASLGVVITIPLAPCGGLAILPLVNVDLNQISLIAFIVVLGILVDDSIVVNENISRHLAQQDSLLTSVIEGTRGVAPSVIVSTLIIIFAFSPLCFLSGGAGDFILPLPAVIIATITVSTLAALFFTPVYRHWLGERVQNQEILRNGWLDKPLSRLQVYYANTILPVALNKPRRYAAACLLLSLLAFAFIPVVPKEFFPDVEREEIFIEIELPLSNSVMATREKVGEIEGYIRQQTGVREVNAFYATPMPRIFGMSSATAVGQNSANMLVFVDSSKVKARYMKDHLNRELNQAFPSARFAFAVVESGPPVGAPLALRLTGNSLDELQAISDEMRQILLAQPGVLNVNDDLGLPAPSLVFVPDGQSLRLHNVNQQQLGEALRLYGEGIKIGEFDNGDNLLDVRLKYKDEITGVSQDLSRLILFNEGGQPVVLDGVARPQAKIELTHITHYNCQRSNTIQAYLDADTPVEKVLAGVSPSLDKLVHKYPDVQLEYKGESAARTEVFLEIGKIFLVVLFLLLLVMVVQFNSLKLALIILATVFLSSSGALYSLFITRTPLGFMALMGIVSLAGVVVRNGVILIEFMEQKVRAGIDLDEAVQQAGFQRLRPILLTVGTSFFGLMPLALGKNLLFKPLAICIAGGLLYSTLLTLILIPCVYYLYRKNITRKEVKRLF